MGKLVRILIVEPFLTVGGEERVVWDLLNLLDRDKFQLEIACNFGGPFQKEIESLDIPLHYFRMKGKWHIDSLFKLIKIIKNGRYDIVHCHGSYASLFTRLAAKICAAPKIIYTMHTIPNQHRIWANRYPCLGYIFLLIFHWLDLITDKVVAVSQSQLERRLKQRPSAPRKMTVINAGRTITIDSSAEARDAFRSRFQIHQSAFLIGLVTLLKPLKGIETFIQAFSMIIEKHPDIMGVVVGEGICEKEYRDMASNMHLNDRLFFAGRMDNIERILPAFDIAVQPSEYEGFSLTMLEYMAAGLPIIASDIPANREAVLENQEALLFPVNNPEKMCDKIIYLYNHKEKRIEIGNAAKIRYQRDFRAETMVEKYTNLYLELVSA